MSNRCPRPLAALVTVVCLSISCLAQSGEIASVKGELLSAIPTPFHDYWVELSDISHRTDLHRVDVKNDGSFEFHSVPAGEYRLCVTNLRGDPVFEQFVTINSLSGNLSVRLPGTPPPRSAPGTVSFTQLRHPPTPMAFQAVASAQRLAESGQIEKAAQELEKAIRLSPEYADAYNNLAVQHMHMNRFEEAAGELTRAIELGGPSPMKLCNLAYAQHRLRREAEAAESTRAALRMDSSYPQAHYILGSILASDPRTRAESIPHLERAAESLPSARAMLETVRRAAR